MSLVTIEKDNEMGIITFNNPPKGFLTSEMIAETIPTVSYTHLTLPTKA